MRKIQLALVIKPNRKSQIGLRHKHKQGGFVYCFPLSVVFPYSLASSMTVTVIVLYYFPGLGRRKSTESDG